jgi:hypothetical protein
MIPPQGHSTSTHADMQGTCKVKVSGMRGGDKKKVSKKP